MQFFNKYHGVPFPISHAVHFLKECKKKDTLILYFPLASIKKCKIVAVPIKNLILGITILNHFEKVNFEIRMSK
jgi:hypothetical protein